MLHFWTAVKRYVEKKERQSWLKLYGFDNACPNCGVWQGNCGGVAAIQREYPSAIFDTYKCGNCKTWFVMRADTAFQILAKDQSPALSLTADEILAKIQGANNAQ